MNKIITSLLTLSFLIFLPMTVQGQMTTIRACVKDNGTMRIVKQDTKCANGEQPLTWNVQGPAGPVGPVGPKGNTGAQGPKGDTGLTGPAGPAGPQGLKGDPGVQGLVGPAGLQGSKGDTGLIGPAGPTGPQEPQGNTGVQGVPWLSEYEVVTAVQAIPSAGGWSYDAVCPKGKTAISGGYTMPDGSTVFESHPRDGDPTVWHLAFTVPGPANITLYLQCARTT